MLAESDGTLSIATGMPNTLQALIAARIDRLPAAEKRLIQRAALIGRIFWEGALTHLSPELDEIAPQLESLVLRELVLPETRSSISGERAYKFKHVLIREVAYGGLSKSARAAQHARFAAWLKERAGEELLEIRAFHLDRAVLPPRRARRRDAGRPRRRGGRGARGRGSPRRWRASRSRPRGSSSCARSSSSRTSSGAGTPRARRSGSATCTRSRSRWRRCARSRSSRASKKLEATALAALAEVALYTQADLPRAKELATQALETLPDDAPIGAKIEALNVRVQIANWIGDHETAEKYLRHVLDAAHDAERKDLEASAIQGLASLYITKLDLDAARPLLERGMELAEESGGVLVKAAVLERCGNLSMIEGNLDAAEDSLHARRSTSTARSASSRASPGGSSTSARSRGSAATSRRRRTATARP